MARGWLKPGVQSRLFQLGEVISHFVQIVIDPIRNKRDIWNMEGTTKQIEYANDIITRIEADLESVKEKMMSHPKRAIKFSEAIKLLDQLKTEANAKFFIEEMREFVPGCRYPNMHLKAHLEMMNTFYKTYKNTAK